MQPTKLTLKGFRGIRDGLGLDELSLDFESLAAGAQLVARIGPNGSGKTTIIDNAHRYVDFNLSTQGARHRAGWSAAPDLVDDPHGHGAILSDGSVVTASMDSHGVLPPG